MEANGKTIKMVEGDYGKSLPFKLSGDVLTTDTIKFTIKNSIHDNTSILEKTFTNLKEEDGKFTFSLSISKEDSEKLLQKEYVYGIKQYRNETLLNTIIKCEPFIVEKGV